MDDTSKLSSLLDLAQELSLQVRTMPSAADGDDHPGGAVVRIKGRDVIFLDSSAAVADQIGVLAGALRGRAELQQRFLPPEIRQLLD